MQEAAPEQGSNRVLALVSYHQVRRVVKTESGKGEPSTNVDVLAVAPKVPIKAADGIQSFDTVASTGPNQHGRLFEGMLAQALGPVTSPPAVDPRAVAGILVSAAHPVGPGRVKEGGNPLDVVRGRKDVGIQEGHCTKAGLSGGPPEAVAGRSQALVPLVPDATKAPGFERSGGPIRAAVIQSEESSRSRFEASQRRTQGLNLIGLVEAGNAEGNVGGTQHGSGLPAVEAKKKVGVIVQAGYRGPGISGRLHVQAPGDDPGHCLNKIVGVSRFEEGSIDPFGHELGRRAVVRGYHGHSSLQSSVGGPPKALTHPRGQEQSGCPVQGLVQILGLIASMKAYFEAFSELL